MKKEIKNKISMKEKETKLGDSCRESRGLNGGKGSLHSVKNPQWGGGAAE